jgi:DNA polymerase III subunit epsilon
MSATFTPRTTGTSTIAVIDFETTGMSPDMGDRPTEVAIVLTEGGRVVDKFQSLMNPGMYVSSFITQLTGITNAMVKAAPPVAQVMAEAARFVGNAPMVAHNASFDRKFWQAELTALGLPAAHPFACTVLLSRRLLPQAPNHQLGTLAQFLRLPTTGRAHRALADAEVTAELLHHLQALLHRQYALSTADHALLVGLQGCTKAAVPAWLKRRAAVPSQP